LTRNTTPIASERLAPNDKLLPSGKKEATKPLSSFQKAANMQLPSCYVLFPIA
jgi:hypothetical protein